MTIRVMKMEGVSGVLVSNSGSLRHDGCYTDQLTLHKDRGTPGPWVDDELPAALGKSSDLPCIGPVNVFYEC